MCVCACACMRALYLRTFCKQNWLFQSIGQELSIRHSEIHDDQKRWSWARSENASEGWIVCECLSPPCVSSWLEDGQNDSRADTDHTIFLESDAIRWPFKADANVWAIFSTLAAAT